MPAHSMLSSSSAPTTVAERRVSRRRLLAGTAAFTGAAAATGLAGNAFARGAYAASVLPFVTPTHAERVRRGYGIGVHLTFKGVWTQHSAIRAHLDDLGVHLMRDRLTWQHAAQLRFFESAGSAGYQLHSTVGTANTVLSPIDKGKTIAALSSLGGMLHSLGMVNEPSSSGGPGPWVDRTIAEGQWLREAIDTNSQLDRVPLGSPSLYAPSLTLAEDYQRLSVLGPLLDFGCMHDYPGGKQADTFTAERLGKLRAGLGNLPLLVTEYGWNVRTEVTNRGRVIPENVQATYSAAAIYTAFLSGNTVSQFELLSEPADEEPDAFERGWGLIDCVSADPSTWVRRPSFHSVSAQLRWLRDGDPVDTLRPVQVSVEHPEDPLLRTLVVGKRGGGTWLIMYRSAQVWDFRVRSFGAIAVPKTPVTVTDVAGTRTFQVGEGITRIPLRRGVPA